MPNEIQENERQKIEERSVFGSTLKMLRKAHRLTQEQVANILKIKRSSYAYYERNITPTLENIKKLSVLFDVSVHFLLYKTEDPRSPSPAVLRDANDPSIRWVSDLKEDERVFLMYYRSLNPQNKEKIFKEIKDLNEKQG